MAIDKDFYNKYQHNFESFSELARGLRKNSSFEESKFPTEKSLTNKTKRLLPNKNEFGDLQPTNKEDSLWQSSDKNWKIVFAGSAQNAKSTFKVHYRNNKPIKLEEPLLLSDIIEWNGGLILKITDSQNLFLFDRNGETGRENIGFIFHLGEDTMHYALPWKNSLSLYFVTAIYQNSKIRLFRMPKISSIDVKEVQKLKEDIHIIHNSVGNPMVLDTTSSRFKLTDIYRSTPRNIVARHGMAGFFSLTTIFNKYLKIFHIVNSELVEEDIPISFLENRANLNFTGESSFYKLDDNNFILTHIKKGREFPNSKSLWYRRNKSGKFELLKYDNPMKLVTQNSSGEFLAYEFTENISNGKKWFKGQVANPQDKMPLALNGNYIYSAPYLIKFKHSDLEIYELTSNFEIRKVFEQKIEYLKNSRLSNEIKFDILNAEHFFGYTEKTGLLYLNLKAPEPNLFQTQNIDFYRVVKNSGPPLVLFMNKQQSIYYQYFVEASRPEFLNLKSTGGKLSLKQFQNLPVQLNEDKLSIGNEYFFPAVKM